MVKPIRPDEVTKEKLKRIPAFVIEAFNELIAENFSDGEARVTVPEAIARIMSKNDISREHIFSRHYLDVEGLYEAQGWKVKFDKACAYGGDTYDSFFEFSKKRHTDHDSPY